MTARPPYSHSPFAQAAPFGGDPYVSAGSRLSRIGYGFAWTLLAVAGAAGLAFSLYRNDVLLNAARRGGWEPRYLAFEARMLGRPGWGTPRSLSTELQSAMPERRVGAAAALTPAAMREPVAVEEPSVAARDTAQGAPAAAAVAAPVPPAPAPQPAAAAPAAAAPAAAAAVASATPARATADGVKIVSLDALATLPVAAPRSAPAPARRASDSTPPARAVPERAAPVAPAKAPPIAKAPVAKAPPPAPARPAPAPANENPLKAAIRNSIAKDSQK